MNNYFEFITNSEERLYDRLEDIIRKNEPTEVLIASAFFTFDNTVIYRSQITYFHICKNHIY